LKSKFETFFKMMVKNRPLLRAYKAPLILTFVLLLVNISLISVPFFFGVLDGADHPDDLEGAHEAFEAFYRSEPACRLEGAELSCEDDIEGDYNSYRVAFIEELPDPEDIEQSSILLTPNNAAVVQIDDDTYRHVAGDYSLHSDLDFADIHPEAQADDNPEHVYRTMSENFMLNLYYSEVTRNIFTTYGAQTLQTILYVMLVSVLFMIANYRVEHKKITWTASIKMATFAMTGPAFLSAALGYWLLGWANMLFLFVYMIRIILVYANVNRLPGPFYEKAGG